MLQPPSSLQKPAGQPAAGNSKMARFLKRSAALSQAFLGKAQGEENAHKGLRLALLSLEFARTAGRQDLAQLAAKEAARRHIGLGQLDEAKALLQEFPLPTEERRELISPLFCSRKSISTAVMAHRSLVWDRHLPIPSRAGEAHAD